MTQNAYMLQQELAKIYILYDTELQSWIASYKREISCHKGCRACCDMSIGLYLPEAIVLANSLTDAQYTRVAEHAQRVFHYACTTSNYPTDYRQASLGWCPFLDEEHGSCSIYDRRPANCRHVFSNMLPLYCAKDSMLILDQDAGKHAEFLSQLDPDVNEHELPFIAPLEKIFSEKYQLYLMILAAKYFNVMIQGEMSWLIMLAREHHLRDMVTGTGVHLSDVYEQLQKTGLYHDNLLTDCEEILPHVKEQSVGIDFTNLY